MPFKSKSQWKACFASKGFGGKVDCEKWAKKTKKFKKLPNKLEMKNEFFSNWLKNKDPEF
jgi:hypothetical protein